MAEAFIEVDRGPAGAPARFARPAEIDRGPGARRGAGGAGRARPGAGRAAPGSRACRLRARLCLRAAARAAAAGGAAAAAPRLRRLRRRRGRREPAAPGGSLGPFRPAWDAGAYGAAFARVAEYIRAGDIYQANLTLPLARALGGRRRRRWRRGWRRAQPVGHGALVALPGATLRLALAGALLRARRARAGSRRGR